MGYPCKKLRANFQHAREILRYFITRAHAIFRQLFCPLIRRITGASARANYRVRTRITLYARIRVRLQIRACLCRSHSAFVGVLAVAGYASPDNITSSRGVKHRQGPSFFTAIPRVAYELHRVYVRSSVRFDADVSRKYNRVCARRSKPDTRCLSTITGSSVLCERTAKQFHASSCNLNDCGRASV